MKVSDREQVALDRLFTDLEIKEAVFHMHPNKSPGLDGSLLFFVSPSGKLWGEQ